MTEKAESLGDLLGRDPAKASVDVTNEPVWLTSRRHEADALIEALARLWGCAPDAVLKDFHSNKPLAEMMRKILGVDENDDPTPVRDYFLVENLVKGEMTVSQAIDLATDQEIANGRLGQNGKPITREAIEQGWKRGKKVINARYRDRAKTITDLFSTSVPHLTRISRKRDK